jgi:diguanylate cyclase (GGDEF)-like protein/PAS domain S-box-containing protein
MTRLLPYLAAYYLLVAAVAGVTRPEANRGLDAYLAYGTGVMALGLGMLLRRGRLGQIYAHAVATGIAGLVLLHNFAQLDPNHPVTTVFLVLAWSGATFTSFRWFGMLTAGALLGWVVAAGALMNVTQLAYWFLILLSTALLATLNLYHRMRKLRQERQQPAPAHAASSFDWARLEQAVDGTQDGLWYWELRSDVFHFTPAWAKLMGFEQNELSKNPSEWLNRVHPGYIGRLRAELTAHLEGNSPHFRNEHRIRRKDGSYVWVLARATVTRDKDGEPEVLAGSHSDITPLIEAERRLLTDAFTDELTSLPNRNFLMGHLEMAVEEKRARGRAAPLFAVMFLDLDRFKFINDTMGHDVGDQLLKAVAGRLKNCARPEDVVARFGGDEFVILLRELKDVEEAVHIGTRMLKALSTPFQLGDRTIQSGGSIGIASSRENFTTSEEILKFGDVAMYQAKSLRNGVVQVFQPRMLGQVQDQNAIRSDLSSAISNNQLVLHYQPCIHLATGRIVGAEALVRWQRTPEQLLYPADFLPLAEKSDLIHEIGDWALQQACKQNVSWQRSGISPIRISVNLSARQLQEKDLPRRVEAALQNSGLRPDLLELEATEASLLRSLDVAPDVLKGLQNAGLRATIDNFGGGNSSLSHLRKLQFQTMKLDRSFITDLATEPHAAAVARGMISFAHSLNLNVVAEGVESRDQVSFLSAENCDHAQGYLTGRPVPDDELLMLLRTGRRIEAPISSENVEADLSRLSALHATAHQQGSAALRWAMERKARR